MKISLNDIKNIKKELEDTFLTEYEIMKIYNINKKILDKIKIFDIDKTNENKNI